MKKKLFMISVIVLVLVLALFAFTACNAADTEYDTELVSNGDFETYTTTDSSTVKLTGWQYGEDWTNSSYELKTLTASEENKMSSELDERYLGITNKSSAYAYLYQEIKVDRKAIYKVSVDVKLASSLKQGTNDTYVGAHVTFLENTKYYFVEQKDLYTNSDTANWKTVTFYVKPVDSDYLTVCLMLGADGAGCTGTAYFDNVSMMKVEEAPSGTTVYDFKKSEIARYNVNVSGVLFVVFLSLVTVAVLAAAYVLIRRLYSRPTAFLNFSQVNGGVTKLGAVGGNGTSVFSSPWFIAPVLAIGTFLVNLIFLLSMYGYGSEMNYTVQLASRLAESGNAIRTIYADLGNTLQSTSPGVLYILAIIGNIGNVMDKTDTAAWYEGMSILIRMINVLATMATVVMIYFYGRKYVGDRQSTIFAALYALLPITLVMTGLDNTFTALLVALLVATVLLLVEKKYLPMYLVFALAVVLDVRALAIAPIVVTYVGYQYYKDDDSMKTFGRHRAEIVFGFVGFLALLYVLTIPAAINYIQASPSKPFYGWTLLANEITKNSVFVDNALGLYGMVAMNQKGSSQTASILNLIFLLVLEMYVISLYVKNRNKQELIMLASFTLAIVAVFTLKISYTYLYLAIALGFIYTMVSGEKRMYAILGSYSLLAFLNIGQLMNNSGFVAGNAYFAEHASTSMYFVNFETTSPDFIIFSIFAVLVTLYYGYVSYSIANNGKLVDIPPMSKPFAITLREWFKHFGANVSEFFAPKKKAE